MKTRIVRKILTAVTLWIQVADGDGASSGVRCLVSRSTVFGWSAALVGIAPKYWMAFVMGY